ncbi:MAG: PKD domain-containing protein [Bacteroidetes bacterium]|nr:PKD domain-containing protein [Bacteroidota bacterium]
MLKRIRNVCGIVAFMFARAATFSRCAWAWLSFLVFSTISLVSAQDLLWATYYGGTSGDYATTVATDDSGYVYLAGNTKSSNAIAYNGYLNSYSGNGSLYAFVAKFSPAGVRQWATYYSGMAGDEKSIAVDPVGNVYLVGQTTSSTGISYNGYQNSKNSGSDAFLVKFDHNGNRIWATYYGGSSDDYGWAVAADRFGGVYLAGYTNSTNGISYNGHQNSYGGNSDNFLVKFDSNGNLIWGTYCGGSSTEERPSVTTDDQGYVYLSGYTSSYNNIASGGYQTSYGGNGDAFLEKYDSSGSLQWGTYYGGGSAEHRSMAIADHSGNVYLSGQTGSSSISMNGFQTSFGGDKDAFLVKFNSSGARIWATYYGGIGEDDGQEIATDFSDNIYLTGTTASTSNISFNGYQDTYGGGNQDAYWIKFDSAGLRQTASYIGGTSQDFGRSAFTDPAGNIYFAGVTYSANAISYNGHQNSLGGSSGDYDAYLLKFSTYELTWNNPNTHTFCGGDSLRISFNKLVARNYGNTYTLQLSDSSGQFATPTNLYSISDSTTGTDSLSVAMPGWLSSSTHYKLRILSSSPADTFVWNDSLTLFTLYANFSVNDSIQCYPGNHFVFHDSSYGAVSYSWYFNDVFSGNSNTDSVANPSHDFSLSGTYHVRLVATNSQGCRDTLVQTMQVNKDASATIQYSNGCLGLSTSFSPSLDLDSKDSVQSYLWRFGDGDSSFAFNPSHAYSDTGVYNVTLIFTTRSGCIDTSTQSTHIYLKPQISLSADSVCRGLNVDYQLSSSNTGIATYQWNFGDGFTSSSTSPSHQYSGAGNYSNYLKTTFLDGTYCVSDYDSIRVLPLPGANFVIDNDTQCYKGNQVCVHLLNQSSNTQRRRVLFDDGYVDVTDAPSDTFVCYSYSDPAGGSYYIAVQMLDSNGCSQSISTDTAVVIHPEFDTDFSQSISNGCFSTEVDFSNSSNQNPPDVSSFYWDFGDGLKDSSNWSSVKHTYTSNGSFTVKLWAENSDGCKDSSFGSSNITNVNYVVDASIDSIKSTCSSNNRIYASQTPISGATIQWVWQSTDTGSNFSTSFSFEFPGVYHPYVLISYNGCDSLKYLDTLTITGPYARIGAITNKFQCQVSDTVYAVNNSDYFGSTMHGAFWNFGDAFAASCTTNYLAGINATGNCRYATDSFNTKHMYDLNHEGCYYMSLIAYDTINGCSDTVSENISLTAPVAGPDSSLGLKGLFTIQSKTCLGPEADKEISVSLSETQPLCGKQSFWIMWDSTCAANTGNFNNYWKAIIQTHNYDYDNAPCDPNGYVTIGLVIQNGDDSLGNVCRDTVYYHNILHFNFMDPRFGSSYDSSSYYCKGSSFDFYLNAANQDSVYRIIWDWGDGSQTDTNTTDTIQHTFANSGSYQIINQIFTKDGCTGSDTMSINIGVNASLSFSDMSLCVGDSFQVLPQIFYLTDGYNYWADSSRLSANKEELFFNFDDGNGYQNLGTEPWVYNSSIKNYLISVAFRDSMSCWDTINYQDSVRVFGVYAEFSTSQDTFLCPQAIAFRDLSSLYDSTANTSQPDDSLITWVWSFGSGLANSSLQNPERYLSAGDYSVQLKVTNTTGCSDSVRHPLVIVGPIANFTFQSDSIGCEPLRVYFKNESSNATNYIWQFNDSGNTVLSTTSDTAFYFDYELYGNFIPTLTAQGSFNQNGITVSCEATYPDSTAWDSLRLVSVYETPNAGFSYTTNCANKSASFTNTSITDNNSILSFLWEFGDGDTSSQQEPTHYYSDTGHYFVILHTYSEHGCEDTLGKEIVIAPQPVAWFSFNEVCLGTTTLFKDSTNAFNDLIYDWQWDFGDGGSSNLEDPFHDYQGDSSYTIILIVTNIGGCMDTASRSLRIHSYPKASFTVSNQCQYDTIRFSDLSTNSEMPLSYSWSLSDGHTSTQKNPVLKYSSPGAKFITQIVSSVWGCKDTAIGGVSVYAIPAASYSVNDSMQCQDFESFAFSDLSTLSSGSYTRNWNFGDGSTDTAIAPVHLYSSYGNYNVSLVVKSDQSCYDTTLHTMTVFAPIEVAFAIDDPFQCEYENNFTFTDTSTVQNGSISRSWYPGDGNSSTDSIYTHAYSDTGSFVVRLVQLSDQGCRDTLEKTVYINPSPRASFSVNDSTQCLAGNLFQLTNSSSVAKGNYTSTWYFGDQDSAVVQDTNHTYSQDSTWQIYLIVQSDSACSDTASHTSITYPMPVSYFGMSDTALCLSGNQFNFYDSSSIKNGSISQFWQFGDGDSSSNQNPSHSYALEGVYTIQLRTQSNFGCEDTSERNLEVYPMPQARISFSDTALCYRDNQFTFIDSSTIVYGDWTREWSLGEGSGDTNQFAVHNYSQDSVWHLALRIVSSHACADSAFQDIYVYPQAQSAFTVNDSQQCESGNLFLLTNLSSVHQDSLSYSWSFGDTNTDTATAPSHSYLLPGIYTVVLIANTPHLCADTSLDTMTVFPNPQAWIGLSDSNLCFRNHQFKFVDSSQIAYGSWVRVWNFGDATTDTSVISTHHYSSDSSYLVALRIESSHGCLDSAFRTYTVYPQASSDFSVNDSDQCLSDHLFILQNLSSVRKGSLSYSWDFGDGNQDTATQVNHSYSAYGIYTVQLVAITPFACNDTFQETMIVYPNPDAKIGINDSLLCFRNHVFDFKDSTLLPYGSHSRLWLFGDGNSDTAQSVLHSYGQFGVYPAELHVESEYGCKDSAFRTYEVYPQAQAHFSINDTVQCFNGHSFDFANQSQLAQGQLFYTWEFGDGQSDTSTQISHQYAVFGDYSVRLIATTFHQCSDTLDQNVRINPNPLTKIWSNDSFQCINAQSFDLADSSTLAEGNYSREWKLGDGDSSELASFTHPYANPGLYTIHLYLESDKGCLDSGELDIEVFPKPFPFFSVNDTDQCLNTNDFQFSNSSTLSKGTQTFVWNFGDGDSSSLENPAHTYQYSDTMRAVLLATSDEGCVDSVKHDMVVFPKPIASWIINDTAQCVNTNDFQFHAQVQLSSGNISHYFWDLENKRDSGDLDTARTYMNPGTYPVSFLVQTEMNCWDTLQNTLTVHPKPHSLFSINDSTQCLNTQNFVFTNTSSISTGTLTYKWMLGDGDSSTDFEPIHFYLKHDTVDVILYAKSQLGCYDTSEHIVIIYPKPDVYFSTNDTDQCLNGNRFIFSNQSSIPYGTLLHQWVFGDGQSSLNKDNVVVYSTQNTYLVQLKETSNHGCSDSFSNTMIVYPKPNPGFSINDAGQCVNTQDFEFSDQSSIDYGNLHYIYRFGTLGEDTSANPSFYFSPYGDYIVRQVLISDHACTDSLDKEVNVYPKPKANYDVNDSAQCVNYQEFQFFQRSSIDDGGLISYHWDFDDGTTATGQFTPHHFDQPGWYQVVHFTQSDSNCWDTIRKSIRVFPKPTASILYNDSAQCLSTNFYHGSSNSFDSTGINGYYWNIDSDSISKDSSFEHHFSSVGEKTLTLRVRSIDGCYDTTSRKVYIKPMPDPGFSGLKSYFCNDEDPVTLTPNTPGGVFSGPNVVDPQYVPTNLWNDTVKYWVEVNGCADSMYQATQVYPFPKVELGPDTTLCKNEFIPFDLTFWGSRYFWNGKETRADHRINSPGTYYVSVTNLCGTATDSITVSFLNDLCRIYLPNAFTPNKDDLHPVYFPVQFDLEVMNYTIFNRWGEIVYKGTIDSPGWDGSFEGQPAQQDVYAIQVYYEYHLHGEKISGILTGNITVLR